MDWSSVAPLLTVVATIVIAFAGGVWALIKWGFGGVNVRIDGVVDLVNVRFDEQNGRMDARFDAVNAKIDAVDTKVDAVDKRVDGVDRRIDELRVDLRALVNRVDAMHMSIVTPAVGQA